MEGAFSFSTITGLERDACLNDYERWLGNQRAKLLEGISDPERLQSCTKQMRSNLASFFQTNYATSQERVAILSGRSAPLHRFIFEQAFRSASQEAPLFKPDFMYFDDWQNQHLYINRQSTTPNLFNSPYPLEVLRGLQERNVEVAIHEDHTRIGGKHTFLIEHWREGLINQIYQYSAPIFPDHHWIADFHFGLRDEWFNKFFSGYSKLYSQREFYKAHGFMEVIDSNRTHILTNDSSQFQQSMDILLEATKHLEQALVF
jgi:hypothetical protein